VCELLDDVESIVSEHLWCIARQASRCRVATSADAQGSGSVQEVMQTIVIRRFEWAVSCDDTTEEDGMGSE
jgi:hypothetical protein